MRTLYFIYK